MKTKFYYCWCVGLGLTACVERGLQQTEDGSDVIMEMVEASGNRSEVPALSAQEIDLQARTIDYEIEKINRRIENEAGKNIEVLEQQKKKLKRYRKQLQLSTPSATSQK